MADILILDTSPISSMIIQYWFPDKKIEFKDLKSYSAEDLEPFTTHYKTRFPDSLIFCFTEDPTIELTCQEVDVDVCFKSLFDVDKFQSQLRTLIQ